MAISDGPNESMRGTITLNLNSNAHIRAALVIQVSGVVVGGVAARVAGPCIELN